MTGIIPAFAPGDDRILCQTTHPRLSPLRTTILSRATQFVDLRLHVKNLHCLESAVDQPGDAIQKSEAEYVLQQKEPDRRARKAQELSLEPAPALRLRSEERGRELPVRFALYPYFRFPVGLLIMLPNVAR